MAKSEKKEKQAGVLKGHWLWGALVLCILLLIDLGIKIAAQVYFGEKFLGNANIVLIPGVIELTYTENPGMAFSIGADASPEVKMGIMIGTAVLMLACIFIYLRMDKRRSCLRWCLVFIVAGGLGNLIDRALFQTWGGEGVRDMVLLDFSVLLESWFSVPPTNFLDFGVCNFADFFIVGGAIALILAMFFFDTDAFFPVGKYKALAKEADEKAEAKAKAERKNAGE